MESIKINREEVQRFLTTQNPDFCDLDSGFSTHDGFGCGTGNGSGYGTGDGFGVGRGCGYDTGFGSYFSHGFGAGAGYRNCSGNGAGFGNGAGEAAGTGACFDLGVIDIKSINGNAIDYVDNIPTIITQIHGNIASGYIVKKDLTFEPCFISKVGNSFVYNRTLEEAVANAEAK